MDSIFHEKQEGSLCAQHCLNALLQGPFFSPVELASLAQRMDDEERIRMAESGFDSDDYQRFVQQPSGNMDDSGYFSVQVISSALDVWGLDLVPFRSSEPLAIEAQQQPESMQAYICNYRDHWFTIRKLGFQWFNLNSLLKEPELISDTYLAIFLAQLQEEGYSIFIVHGNLPTCVADEELKIMPAVRKPKKPINQPIPVASNDPELDRAIRMSLGQDGDIEEDEDADLKTALQLSLQEDGDDPALQKAIALSLPSSSKSTATSSTTMQSDQLASSVSYQTTASTLSHHDPTTQPGATVDPEEIRRRRLAYLDKKLDPSTTSGTGR